jgi:hypothetical protein
MARGRGFLVAAIVAGLGTIALAGTARAEDLSGTWTIVDGKFAGTQLGHADSTGRIGIHAEKGEPKGFVRPPNDHCSTYHFEGRVGGKPVRETDCARVVSAVYIHPFLFAMQFAIEQEDDAKHAGRVRNAIQNLSSAFDEFQTAVAAKKLTPAVADRVEKWFLGIHKLDERAIRELKHDDNEKAEKLLQDALDDKYKIVRSVPDDLKFTQPPVVQPMEAEFQPASFQTVYTVRATDPTGRVLSYTWSLTELNDPPCVNLEPNKPAAFQAIWHHPDSQCNHTLEGSNGHQGVVAVAITVFGYRCLAAYFGSSTGTGGPAACEKVAI